MKVIYIVYIMLPSANLHIGQYWKFLRNVTSSALMIQQSYTKPSKWQATQKNLNGNFSATLQYPQCARYGDTAISHQTIDFIRICQVSGYIWPYINELRTIKFTAYAANIWLRQWIHIECICDI